MALRLLPNPLPSLVIIVFSAGLLLWFRSPSGTAWREAILTDTPGNASASGVLDGVWFVAGLLFLGTALFLLEWRQPYYFVQNDAMISELPGILVGCRGLWEGIWPNYNPYSYMGAPLANLGLYSLTYPPTLASYAIARHLLADENATLDVFAMLHLAAGYVVTFGLVRQQRCSAAVATMVSLCVVLSGSSLIMGRNWHAFVPLVVWLSVLAWGLVRLGQGPVGWSWMMAMGCSIGLTFHVGFPQLSLYVTGFFLVGVAALLLLGVVPWPRALFALPALLVGIGLSLPIFLPQLRAAASMRPRLMGGFGLPWPDAWLCMFLPYPFAQAPHPNYWGTWHDDQYMGEMYFFGGLLGVLFFANALALFSARQPWPVWRGHFWFLGGFILFLLMLRSDLDWPWTLLRRLPVVGRIFNHPFRLLPFFVLFASLAGGLVLERILRRTGRRRAWEVLLGVGVGGLLLYHAWVAEASFFTWPFRPFSTLPDKITAALGPPTAPTARVMAWTPQWSMHPCIGYSLIAALPAAYRVPAFHGYDPVVENCFPYVVAADKLREAPLAAARAYGIRWHLTVLGQDSIAAHKAEVAAGQAKPPYEEAFLALQPLKLPRAHESGAVLLTELDNVDPLAFMEGRAEFQLPMRMHAGGIDVDLASAAGNTVIVNFLWRPEMQASVDGLSVSCEHDDWLRLRVRIPPGGQKLEVRYEPDWTQGLLLGCIAILLGVLVQLQLLRNTTTTAVASRAP